MNSDSYLSENKIKEVERWGQVFTPPSIVRMMLKMIKNQGRVLEPSCGQGAFSDNLPDCVAIEIDETKRPNYAYCIDFFAYPLDEKFDTIIGNPPYVRYQDIHPSTKLLLDETLFDKRSNLYLFFIHKCIQHLNPHGELIFIVPREFLKATSAIKLNSYLFRHGTITSMIDLGDETVFSKHSPNCIIFRYEKGNFERKTTEQKQFTLINGQFFFLRNSYPIQFSDLFYVKVGATSGADECFEHPLGNLTFVTSETRRSGRLKQMFYNQRAEELEQHKERLMSRKIKSFTNDDWFMWGRNLYSSEEERIYVNYKTRTENPFFYHECKNYTGSILAIFPKFKCDVSLAKTIAAELNQVSWSDLGFVCGTRFLFSQKSLENSVLPETFRKYLDYP